MPSTAETETAVGQQARIESHGKLKIVLFIKTNGVVREHEGAPAYAVEFDAVLEATESCRWILETGNFHSGFFTDLKPDYQYIGISHPKGDKFPVSGHVLFEKAENGWRVVRLIVDRETP
jgi:hypothetical protein